MKKNHSKLFIAVGFVILLYVVLSYIFPSGSTYGVIENLETNQIGLSGLLSVLFEAFSGFGSIFIFVAIVGAFYGIAKAAGIYQKTVSFFKNRFNKKETLFLVSVIILIALLSSVCGLELGLFFLFPFVISVLLALGYDKFTGLCATLGATIVGIFGATYAGTLFKATNDLIGLGMQHGMILKLSLFVLGLGALIFFTLSHAKKVKGQENDAELLLDDVIVEEQSNKSVWPFMIIFDLVLILFVLGTTDWASIFGSNWFSEVHPDLMSYELFEFDIFNVFFGKIDAFGTWFTPTRFNFYSMILIVSMLAISLIYKVRLSKMIDGFMTGVKEYLVPAVLTSLACSVFILVFYYPTFVPIGSYILSLADNFNLAIAGLFEMLGSIFYVDIYYYSYYVISHVVSFVTDSVFNPLVNVMFVSIYGLMMLIAPTSMILLTSLSLTNISYKDWLKYIWKLFLALFVIAFALFGIAYIGASMNHSIGFVLGLIIVILVVISVITIVALWKYFKTKNVKGWYSLIPVYNMVVLFKLCDVKPILVLLLFVPIANLVVSYLCYRNLAAQYKKGMFVAICLVLFPFITLPLLVFNK